jgi:hypothetical protein
MSKMNSPLFVFLVAKEYFENGTLYASKYFQMSKDGTIKPFNNLIHTKLCVPATNISFSLELVFKAFLMQTGLKKFDHNLLKLFELLPDKVKSDIIEHYNSHDIYKKYVTVQLINSDGNEHGKIKKAYYSTKSVEFIPMMLDTHKLSFLTFRYLHEFKGNEAQDFYFREFSNFTFSALSILGKSLDLAVVSIPLNN